jgi:hypothetical protein
MILMAAVTINSNGDRDGGGGGGGGGSDDGNSRNSRNGDNGDRSGRNGIDWEVEWIEGTDSEKMMSATVELGMGVTVEDI